MQQSLFINCIARFQYTLFDCICCTLNLLIVVDHVTLLCRRKKEKNDITFANNNFLFYFTIYDSRSHIRRRKKSTSFEINPITYVNTYLHLVEYREFQLQGYVKQKKYIIALSTAHTCNGNRWITDLDKSYL